MALSPTHEEFIEARHSRDVLVFIQSAVVPDPSQARLIREVQDWAGGLYTGSFSTPETLHQAVIAALHKWELAKITGAIDEQELLDRATAMVPPRGPFRGSSLTLVVAGAPKQNLLRPAEIERGGLGARVRQEALFGPSPVFDPNQGSQVRIEGDHLLIEQDEASVLVDPLGTIRVVQPAVSGDRPSYLPVIIEEHIVERLNAALVFSLRVLDDVDPTGKLTHVALVAALSGGGYMGWKTLEERQRDPNRVTMGRGGNEMSTIHLSPAVLPRAALRVDRVTLAEDLMVLLRRETKP